MSLPQLHVKKGASVAKDPWAAVAELHTAIFDPLAALTIVFCSPAYDRGELAAALRDRFGGANVIGCTTAGEITPNGYAEGSLSGVSLTGADISVVVERIEDLQNFRLADGTRHAERALRRLEEQAPERPTVGNSFGFLLIDGLSLQEDSLVASVYERLDGIALLGGSAGDGKRFGSTFIYADGEFRSGQAVLALVQTSTPFRVFKTEHFVAGSERLVVTKADPARRIVSEINGELAAPEYARAVGLDVAELTPMIFASHPVVVRVGGVTYVRSIQKVNDDGSLTFFCAIDDGIVLTVAQGVDMVANLQATLDRVKAEIGEPELVLGCDCILRLLEADQKGLRPAIGKVLATNNVIGFCTYGEQYNAMHVNQTFTGVALGRPRSVV